MLRRRYDSEIMDDFSIQDSRIDDALDELKLVNRFLGGVSTTRKGLSILRRAAAIQKPATVLDVGAGGCDVFGRIEALSVTAIDRNPRACAYIRDTTTFTVLCGDAESLPVENKSFDIVHASLFFHHFRRDRIIGMLKNFSSAAKYGIIINDLRRSIWAYAGILFLTRIFSRSRMVRHDGPLSVLRGFSKSELTGILDACGFERYSIRRTWAFRWLVVIFL